jgi:hypothetical protein
MVTSTSLTRGCNPAQDIHEASTLTLGLRSSCPTSCDALANLHLRRFGKVRVSIHFLNEALGVRFDFRRRVIQERVDVHAM